MDDSLSMLMHGWLMIGWLLLSINAEDTSMTPAEIALVEQIAASGRCASVAETPDKRITPTPLIAPGQPPSLSFRYYEGKLHHRYGNMDLMLDDAGH